MSRRVSPAMTRGRQLGCMDPAPVRRRRALQRPAVAPGAAPRGACDSRRERPQALATAGSTRPKPNPAAHPPSRLELHANCRPCLQPPSMLPPPSCLGPVLGSAARGRRQRRGGSQGAGGGSPGGGRPPQNSAAAPSSPACRPRAQHATPRLGSGPLTSPDRLRNFLPSSPSTRPKPTWSMRTVRSSGRYPAFLAAANTCNGGEGRWGDRRQVAGGQAGEGVLPGGGQAGGSRAGCRRSGIQANRSGGRQGCAKRLAA